MSSNSSNTARPDPSWAYQAESLAKLHAELLDEQAQWRGELVVDALAIHREISCLTLDPAYPGALPSGLERSVLFLRLIRNIYFSLQKANLLDEVIDPSDVRRILKGLKLPAIDAFYTEVEQAICGKPRFTSLVAGLISILHNSLVETFGQDIVQTDQVRSDSWVLENSEFGVVEGNSQFSSNLVKSGDAIVFVHASEPVELPRGRRQQSLASGILEVDVMISVAAHFLKTGIPARSIAVVDLSTKSISERTVEPNFFERSVNYVRSAFQNANQVRLGNRLPPRGGPWCVICSQCEHCPVSECGFDSDDGDGDEL